MENQNNTSDTEVLARGDDAFSFKYARSPIDAQTQALLSQLKEQFSFCFKNSHKNDFDLVIVQVVESRDVNSLFESGVYYYQCLEKVSEKYGDQGNEYTIALLRIAYWHYLSASMQDDLSKRKLMDIIASTRFLGYLSGRRNAPIAELLKLADHGRKFPSGRAKDQLVHEHLKFLKKHQGASRVKQLYALADQNILKNMSFETFENRMSAIKIGKINPD